MKRADALHPREVVELTSRTALKPLGSRVVIERLRVPEHSRGGLLVLGREFPALGRVLCLTLRAYAELDHELQVGDLVYFNRASTELRSIPREPNNFILDSADLWVRIRESE